MASEEALYQQSRDGLAAEHELDLLGGAFATLKATYLDAWEKTGARDTEAREKLWQAVQIVGKVESHLRQVARTGQAARKMLDEIAAKPKRFGII